MTWQVLILTSVFLYSISVLLQRILLKEEKSDPKTYAVFFQLLTGLMIGMFGLVFADMSFPDVKPLVFNLVLMTLLYGFGNVLIFESLKRIEASRFTIIFSSRALFTILASSLLLKEGLLAKQFVGTFLILAGIALANVKAARFSFSKKEAMALFAAMIFGFVNTNDRFLLKSFKVYPYVFLAFIVPALFIIALNPYTIKNMKFFVEKKVLLKMLLLCVIYAVSSITFFASLQIAQSSSQVASINLTSVIVIVLLAIIFLKERDFLIPKLLGAASSFVGLLLVS